MSYTELYVVRKNGVVDFFTEFKNSGGGAAFIWDRLCEKHLGGSSWLNDETCKRLWALANNKSVPLIERIVLRTTFDYMIVTREYFQVIVHCFRKFEETFHRDDVVCSLREQADVIEKLAKRKSVHGICWNQTSVNCDMWKAIGAHGKRRRYNLKKEEKHRFLFWYTYDAASIMKELES